MLFFFIPKIIELKKIENKFLRVVDEKLKSIPNPIQRLLHPTQDMKIYAKPHGITLLNENRNAKLTKHDSLQFKCCANVVHEIAMWYN